MQRMLQWLGRRVPAPTAPAPPQAPRALPAWFYKLLQTTRLAEEIGRRQAEYLVRMLSMFDEGDLESALRHAIPLGKGDAPGPPALGTPRPRDGLSISLAPSRGAASIGLSPDLHELLRARYRAAFERLKSQGKVEEAAFVLAELLQATEEAVLYLEQSGRLALAAELAEARGLPPGLVVRQWILAGDRDRAVKVARREGAFADAVVRLERGHPAVAQVLRMLWAEHLADAGDYAAAVEVAWAVPEARALTLSWMDLAIDAGGPASGRMLARKVALLPESHDALRPRCVALLEDREPENAEVRWAFARALTGQAASDATRPLARLSVRALLRDAPQLHGRFTGHDLRTLLTHADDGPLRVDAPEIPVAPTAGRGMLRLEIGPADTGNVSVHDAALLPSGRVVAALGEAGARLMTRDGRIVTQLSEPASKLVVSDRGDRAIALAPRGEVSRLSILDFAAQKARPWCDARLTAIAADYDGAAWMVAIDREVVALDATAPHLEALWHNPDLPEPVIAIARSQTSCALLTGSWGLDLFRYELPRFLLRRRVDIDKGFPGDAAMARIHALHPDGAWLDMSPWAEMVERRPHALPVAARLWQEDVGTRIVFPLPGEESPLAALVTARTLALATRASWTSAAGVRVTTVDRQSLAVTGEIRLARAAAISLRARDEVLTIADDLGRLLAIDLDSGRILRDLRVRA
ncbi:MAG: hypothetical protein U0166_22435 [Acidobacteriota bacterium]